MTASENLNSFWASLLVDELVRLGVRLFCISPGSRSAPLVVAVARHPQAEAVIAHDERGAAYLAVGYAKACGKPAAVIATSGTAGANYLPAVVEASEDWTPLLVLTADRPPELQDVGANQTIRQGQLFGEFVRQRFTLPCPDEKIPADFLLSTLDWAVAAAVEKSGPVHINIMFREPLAPKPTPFSFPTSPAFSRWQQDRKPFTVYTRPPDTGRETARQILPLLQNASHPLLIIGRRPPFHDCAPVTDLITALQWPTHIDVLHPLRFAVLDAPLVDERRLLAERPPIDCALHLGGPFISKQLHAVLEANPPRCFVHIDEFPRRTDPGHWVTHHFNAAPETVARALAEQLPRRSSLGKTVDWNKEWLSAELCEPAAAFWISRLLPDEHGLFLGNSMPVRDMHWFAARSRKPRPVGGNRGVSGIDGTVAAAVGFARGLAAPTTLLIGDLALLHDLNSLLLAARSPLPLTIVVLNNNGGGIFAFLPIADYAEYNDYFQTPHSLQFKKAAELFGLDYEQPQSVEAFKAAFQRAVTGPRSTLIEVISDSRHNRQLHRRLEEMIRRGIPNPT